MPAWKTDNDGLIRSVNQTTRTHPCECVVASASRVDLREPVETAPTGRRASDSDLIRLAHGVYLRVCEWNEKSVAERYLSQVKALVKPGSSTVIAGEAAAALHGLPLLLRGATIPLADSGLRARSHARVRRVRNSILTSDIVEIEGRRVTDVPKTVIDICRNASSENGLIAADAAVRGWCTPTELRDTLAAYPHSPGNRRARAIIAMATDRSESIGESLTKGCVLDSGIASLYDGPCILLQQVDFHDEQGFIGRVDFYIPELNLVIEFDGAMKYSAGSVKATEETLLREQAREKRLKNLHLDVLRLCWTDVLNGRCVGFLQKVAARQRERIRAGGLVFSSDCGRFREAPLSFKERQLREKRVLARRERACRGGSEVG